MSWEGGQTIFFRNSAGTASGFGLFGMSAQGSSALFWGALQCRLISRSMVFQGGGGYVIPFTGPEEGFSEMYGFGP